jgi:hypothetical protein
MSCGNLSLNRVNHRLTYALSKSPLFVGFLGRTVVPSAGFDLYEPHDATQSKRDGIGRADVSRLFCRRRGGAQSAESKKKVRVPFTLSPLPFLYPFLYDPPRNREIQKADVANF